MSLICSVDIAPPNRSKTQLMRNTNISAVPVTMQRDRVFRVRILILLRKEIVCVSQPNTSSSRHHNRI